MEGSSVLKDCENSSHGRCDCSKSCTYIHLKLDPFVLIFCGV